MNRLYNRHAGQTCIIASCGPNLKFTPPEWFDYPSFGINTIYKYKGWKPDYYVWVDRGVVDFPLMWKEVNEVYPDVAKFVPSPDSDELDGQNVYRFKHRDGIDLYIGGQSPNRQDSMTGFGITYRRILDAVLQIAWWMGFTTILLIGVEHKPGTRKEHFWGRMDCDPSDSFLWEEKGLQDCYRMMTNVRILNISENTYLPEEIIPRDDWRKWRNK